MAAFEEIVLMAAVFAAFTFVVNKTFGKRDRLRQIQKEVNEYHKQLQQAILKKDEAEIKRLEAREKEMMGLTKEMLFLPMRSLIIIGPAIFIAYSYIGSNYEHFMIRDMPFYVPASINVFAPWKNWLGARGLFIYLLVLFGFIELGLTSLWERFKKGRGLERRNAVSPSEGENK